MIQRIQSAWLLLAAITLACLLFIPIISATAGGIDYHFITSGIYQQVGTEIKQIENTLPLFIGTIVLSLICFANIFNFRNRTSQKRTAYLTVVLILALAGWGYTYAANMTGGLTDVSYGAGIGLPVLAIVFCLLAVRGINNDEKLLKSADRLR